MKLRDVKGCIESEILARLGYPNRNLELCSEKVGELANEIENDIKRYGDVDAGLLCCAGVEMRYMTHHCANQMMRETHDKYPTDFELIEAIDTLCHSNIRRSIL